MSAGLNFQYLSGLSRRESSRSFCSVGADVEHALDDHVTLGDQPGLELVDLVVPTLHRLRVGQPVHPDDQDVLVVRPVEDPEVARGREGVAHAPQEVVLLLLVGRRLEAGDLHALRVDQTDGVPQHAALARGVHPLEHQEHPALGPGGALGPQPLLQVAQLVTERRQSGSAVLLAAVEAGGVVGRERGQVDRSGRKPMKVRRHASIMSDPVSAAPSSSRTTANARPAGYPLRASSPASLRVAVTWSTPRSDRSFLRTS